MSKKIIIDDKYLVRREIDGYFYFSSNEKNNLEIGTIRLIDEKLCILQNKYITYKRKLLFRKEINYEMYWLEINFSDLKNKTLRDLIQTKIEIDKQQERLLKVKKEIGMEKNDKKS